MNHSVTFKFITPESTRLYREVDTNALEDLIGRLSKTHIQKGSTDISLRFKGTNPKRIEGFTQNGKVWKLTSTKIQAFQEEKPPKNQELKVKKKSSSSEPKILEERFTKVAWFGQKPSKVFPILNWDEDSDFFVTLHDDIISYLVSNFCAHNEASSFSITCKRIYALTLEIVKEKIFLNYSFKELIHEKIPDDIYKKNAIRLELSLALTKKLYPHEDVLVTIQRFTTEFPKFKALRTLSFTGYNVSSHLSRESDIRIFTERLIFGIIIDSTHLPLKYVRLINVAFSHEQIEQFVKNHPNLKNLEINKCFIENARSLKVISDNYPRIEKFLLILQDLNITNAILKTISLSCKNLTHFLLTPIKNHRPCITEKGLITIAKNCKSLKAFGAIATGELTDKVLKKLAATHQNLTEVNFSGCKSITDDGIKNFVKHVKTLQTLILSGTKITDISLKSIGANCHKLIFLRLRNCKRITDRGILKLIQGTPKLKNLDLSHTNVTEKSLESLDKNCPHLHTLSLISCAINAISLAVLASNLPDLKILIN